MKRYTLVYSIDRYKLGLISILFHSIPLKNLTGSRIANLTVKIAQAVHS